LANTELQILRGPGLRDSDRSDGVPLSERQGMVLRAIVTTYVADAVPASSATVSHLLSVSLSSASIRNTMAELERLGLIEKPHASAGRIPTERGLRRFLESMHETPELAAYERRSLESSFANFGGESVMKLASQLLCERTHQLGFALPPRAQSLVLQHLSLVRVARDKLLVVVVPKAGPSFQQLIDEVGDGDQIELDRIAAALNERVVGRTLSELRDQLTRDVEALRKEAHSLALRAVALGLRVFSTLDLGDDDLVLSSRLELLSQPEFDDPDRMREILAAVETNERLLELLTRVLENRDDSVSISLGEDLEEPGLRRCAVVAIPYGGTMLAGTECGLHEAASLRPAPVGVLGVIGPSRMDYARVVPLVHYCSKLVTEKLNS